MEKPLAQQAGIGWQGKHTNLVSREFGSWLFLGEIYLSLALEPDPADADHCGTCRQCLDACPTNAFPAPYRLDARRCISYLTIEHKGMIAPELRPLIGNRIYGCDDCLAACPWNKYARATEEPDFLPRPELTAPHLAELAGLDDAGVPADVRRHLDQAHRPRPLPAQRADRDRQYGDAGLIVAARECLNDSAPDCVRASAVWAYARLAGDEACRCWSATNGRELSSGGCEGAHSPR